MGIKVFSHGNIPIKSPGYLVDYITDVMCLFEYHTTVLLEIGQRTCMQVLGEVAGNILVMHSSNVI